MSRASFVTRRILQLGVTFWAVGTVLFFMFRLMPGDPTSFIISPQMTPEARQQIIASYGLDEPLYVQYVKFLQNALTLDFGQSFQANAPVQDVIMTYLPNTLILMLTAFVIAYVLGITLGVLSGWYRGSRFERSTVITALVARSVPSFWVGLMVLWVFGAGLGIIPMSGMTNLGTDSQSFWGMVFSIDFLQHLAAPALVLAYYFMGYPTLPTLVLLDSKTDSILTKFWDISAQLRHTSLLIYHNSAEVI